MAVDIKLFTMSGLGYSEEKADRSKKAYDALCLLVGAAFGTGVALVAFGDVNRAGQGHGAPKNLQFILTAIGFGVGLAVTSGVCASAKIKIMEFFEAHTTTEAALAALTAKKKSELHIEFTKLISIQDKLDAIAEELKPPRRFSSDRWA